MSNRVDKLRALKEGLAESSVPSQRSGRVKGLSKKSSRASRLAERLGESKVGRRKTGRESFKAWIRAVGEEVDVRTGMDLDILPDAPWREYYDAGMSAKRAVSKGLEQVEAELEADTEDDYSDGGILESLAPRVFRRSSLRRRSPLLDGVLDIGEGLDDSGEPLELDEVTGALAGLIEALDSNEDEPDSLEESGGQLPVPPVRRGNDMMSSAIRAVKEDQEATVKLLEGGWTPTEPVDSGDPKVNPAASKAAHLRESETSAIARAAAAIKLDTSEIKAPAFSSSSQGVSFKSKGEEEVSEASVLGGDYGRWGPATSAVTTAGKGVASAITKKTGERYTLAGEGTPQSSSGGSELWFAIEPKDSKKPMYFLGVKLLKGDGDQKWNVMLKKGMGLGSASGVASVKGVETSGLSGAVGSLKG